MKIKEAKEQALLYFAGTSGMGGVEIKGVKTPAQFWEIPDIKKGDTKKYTSKAEVDALIRMFGR